MKKSLFIVSPLEINKNSIKNFESIFITDPYLIKETNLKDILSDFKGNITIADRTIGTETDYLKINEFLDKKYALYINIISKRLNIILNVNYDILFWQKCFSLFLHRTIVLLYESFKVFEKSYDPALYHSKVLDINCFYTPNDLNELLHFLLNTHFGQEQIFSLYLNLVYSEKQFDIFSASFLLNDKAKPEVKISPPKKKKNVYEIISGFSVQNILKKVYLLRKPLGGILYSYFSKSNLDKLIIRSKGKIAPINIDISYHFDKKVDIEKREEISRFEDDFDSFDKFFFCNMRYLMPKIFIEEFTSIYNHFDKIISPYKSLKYIVSEAWIGNSILSFILALFQQCGVKHLNNEHNGVSYQVLGDLNKHISSMCDYFLTSGWESLEYPNLIKAASLFEYNLNQQYKKKYDILFVAEFSFARRMDYRACDSSAENFEKYIYFQQKFFGNLSKDTIKRIVFRSPKLDLHEDSLKLLYYHPENHLQEYANNFFLLDDNRYNLKIMMRKSKLVVVNYIMTSHMHSIAMNIPTIIFWNKSIYYLSENFKDYFDEFIDVGICQTDPIEAAKFVEEIKDNPEEWWNRKEVQNARIRFLESNIGHSDNMINLLISLTKKF